MACNPHPVPLLSPIGEKFYSEFERWRLGAAYGNSEHRDVRPLANAAARLLMSNPPIPQVAPCFAALYFRAAAFDGSAFKRQFTFGWIRLMRVLYRGRPMWNDFWMALWQLSRDPRYVGKLYNHLKHANAIQQATGRWMVTSVCEQDPVFAEHWGDCVTESGEVF